ncbi:uncharacterized protein Gasu_06600 [Galdieria sulphuraria]|uniref:Uncharacterized protein n=1 Tax=Galdieria sulphuraria TaxID=130081 RepID=M2W8P8_GALSU|nr:uncharacterized protein Gasu_06600 [Galdieria sulphuraria]EME32251.1 hypothetical protein Gasu_06600 [Galdieria sulphuraria]|eukprot:XP_005708771.1 hypothetical protein Gasu_06600 [Galdieria sulphuraria]
MEKSQQINSDSSEKLDQKDSKERVTQHVEQQTEEQSRKSNYLVLDWSEESLEPVSADSYVFSTEQALAALTISNEKPNIKLDSKKDERQERCRTCLPGSKNVLTAPSVRISEDSGKIDDKSNKVEEHHTAPLEDLNLATTTVTAIEGRGKKTSAPKQTTQTVERGAWKEEWLSKGIKAFEISCRSSDAKLCEVKDILRLPGLLFVDIDKDTFIAAYRSVEKAQRSITRLSTTLALTITPIMEASEKSQKIFLEKCPPSNRPPKTTVVAERLIFRSLGLSTAAASGKTVER